MEGYIAEIRMFAGNFNPRSWMYCDGSLQSIAQNTALFSLIGTLYGGNGQTTFALPDLRGRIAVGAQNSQGPGLPSVQMGEMSGSPTATLILTNLPFHNHTISGTVTPQGAREGALGTDPTNRRTGAANVYTDATDELNNMAGMNSSSLATGFVGNNAPFNKMPPYLGMNYIICVEGIYPSRN